MVLVIALLTAGCGDNIEPATRDSGVPDTVTPDTPPQATGACIDRPTDLPRPPVGSLDCDMLPPGFVATEAP